LVRDDGSSDQTVMLVTELAKQDSRIQLIEDDKGSQGVIGNFALLMEIALAKAAEYVFFVDQDDIWMQDKMKIMLGAMQELELSFSDTPLLVHSNLEVVDEQLARVSPSFAQYSRLSPTTANLGVLFCQNQVTGCATLINRKVLELALPLPQGVVMHDWWLALISAACGKIAYIPNTLVKYCQHGGNVLGAVSLWKRVGQLLF